MEAWVVEKLALAGGTRLCAGRQYCVRPPGWTERAEEGIRTGKLGIGRWV